jgi:hypothetical protein
MNRSFKLLLKKAKGILATPGCRCEVNWGDGDGLNRMIEQSSLSNMRNIVMGGIGIVLGLINAATSAFTAMGRPGGRGAFG